jgi:hypothetical protein
MQNFLVEKSAAAAAVPAWPRWLQTASDAYDQLTFQKNDLYHQKAPEPWISFMIGGVSTWQKHGQL